MKILYVNSVSQHEVYDVCLLQCVAKNADSVECYFSTRELTYANQMNERYGISNVNMHSIKVFHSKSNAQFVFKLILSAIQNIRFFLLHRNVDYIIYCYNNPLFLPLLYWCSNLIGTKVLVSCHGELESLIKEPAGNWSRASKFLLTRYLKYKRIPANIKFMVLGQSILDNLIPILPEYNRNQFYTMNDPNIFDEVNIVKNSNSKKRFGVVGVLSFVKGLEDFRKLVDKVSCYVDLEVVGKVADYEEELRQKGVAINDHYLSREEFENRVSQLDAVLFFYPSDTYKLIASAALLDTMKFRKPVISYANDFFKYVREESNYPISFVNSLDEMAEEILNFKLKDNDIIYSQSMSKFSIDYCSKQLQRILMA